MTDALHPRLYAALARIDPSGVVQIVNQGQERVVVHLHGKRNVIVNGEEYVIRCPFCGKKKLSMNYSNFTRDPDRPDLMRQECLFTRRWRCWACDAEKSETNRTTLRNLVQRGLSGRAIVLPPAVRTASDAYDPRAPSITLRLPPDFVRLDELEPRHAARRYVAGRGFDPSKIAQVWGVGYSGAAWADNMHRNWCRAPEGRLVIPYRHRLAPHFDYVVIAYRSLTTDGDGKYLN